MFANRAPLADAGHTRKIKMAKTNYQFEKRSREIAQKKKKEEKRLRKLAERTTQPKDGVATAQAG